MRITIPTTSFYPYPCSSGISNAVYFLCQVLSEKYGIRPNVVMPKYKDMKDKEEFENFSIERFKIQNIADYTFSTQAFDMIKNNKPDTIHSFHYGYFPVTAGFSVARSLDVPHFFTTAYHPSASWKKSLLWLYSVTQGRNILKNSNAVFPFNKNEMEGLKKQSEGKYKIIPCPLDDDTFYPKRKLRSKITIGFVGTMLPWKGPQIAMDIFKKIEKERDDVEFVFVGQGPMEKNLQKKGGKKFRFYSGITSEILASIYNSIDILVIPTRYESFGYVIAEALMCGTPVVSTKVGAVPETLGPGGIIVEYGDWEAMKKAVVKLIEDEKTRKKLSRAGLKHSENYKKKKVVREIYESYRKYS